MVKETVIIKKEKKPRTQKQIDATRNMLAANKAKREAKKAAAAAPVAAIHFPELPAPVAPVAPAPVKKARKPRVKKTVIKEPPILLEDSSSDDEPVEQIPVEMHKAPVRPVTSHRTPKHLRY